MGKKSMMHKKVAINKNGSCTDFFFFLNPPTLHCNLIPYYFLYVSFNLKEICFFYSIVFFSNCYGMVLERSTMICGTILIFLHSSGESDVNFDIFKCYVSQFSHAI